MRQQKQWEVRCSCGWRLGCQSYPAAVKWGGHHKKENWLPSGHPLYRGEHVTEVKAEAAPGPLEHS